MIFVMAFLILGVVGMFTFEVSRANLAREQLRAACQAAALAGAATLASSDISNTTQAHQDAVAAALVVLRKNLVIGNQLTNASQSNTYDPLLTNQVPGNCLAFFEFLNPHANNAVVPVGDPSGKVLKVTASFGLQPSFGAYLGINTLPIVGIASAGVPQLDVVLCFDVSGSIDDQTPVSFVRRTWDGSTGKNSYTVIPARSGSAAGALAQGNIYDIVGPPATGTGLNANYPQNLSSSRSNATWPLYFSEDSGAGAGKSAVGLRGKSNAGSPPGNYPGEGAGTGGQYTFTDLVVNIDGKSQFQGISSNGYSFPDIGTVVEAARGNLENDTVFQDSKANTALSVTPSAGYQQEYFNLAVKNTHPIVDAQDAAQLFYTIMNHDTDGHFGLVCFNGSGGSKSSSTTKAYNVDSNYSTAGSGSFPLPNIAVVNTAGVSNYSSVSSVLPTLRAEGNTNIGDAVNKAVTQLQTNGRIGSKKAIVVFTDGQPTAGGPLDSDPWKNARKAAEAAKAAGIPIYSIGLAQNSAIITGEKAILNDWDNNPNTGGISAIAGNGGRFFLVTNQQNLRLTFENLARQLVLLVRTP